MTQVDVFSSRWTEDFRKTTSLILHNLCLHSQLHHDYSLLNIVLVLVKARKLTAMDTSTILISFKLSIDDSHVFTYE